MCDCRVIICDDEPLAVRLLESYCRRMGPGVEVAGVYTDPEAAMTALRAGGIDVAILDIEMPGYGGLEIARALDGCDTDVIFVTAYRDYAVEGFRVHAADYLLKPVSYDEFAAALTRVVDRRRPRREAPQGAGYLTVRSDYRLVRLRLDDIVYVEGLKDYVKIYVATRERPVITLMTMKALEQALPPGRFVRVHRSYIVAADRIESYDRTAVRVGTTSLPVGDTYRHRLAVL